MGVNQDLKDAGLHLRIGIIVYLKNISDQYKLRRYGDIVYFSKRMKYCVIYIDKKESTKIKDEILDHSFVKKVEFSTDEKLNLDSNHIEHQLIQMSKEVEAKLEENGGTKE